MSQKGRLTVSRIAVLPIRPNDTPLTLTLSIAPSQNPVGLTLGNSVKEPVNLDALE